MEKIYKDGEVLEAVDLNASFSELEEKINSLLNPQWKPVTLLSGWTSVAGHEPQYCVIGKTVILTGAVRRQSGGYKYAILTVGTEARPPRTIFAGAAVTNDGTPAELYIDNYGKLSIETYERTGSGLYVLPISCSYQLIK